MDSFYVHSFSTWMLLLYLRLSCPFSSSIGFRQQTVLACARTSFHACYGRVRECLKPRFCSAYDRLKLNTYRCQDPNNVSAPDQVSREYSPGPAIINSALSTSSFHPDAMAGARSAIAIVWCQALRLLGRQFAAH